MKRNRGIVDELYRSELWDILKPYREIEITEPWTGGIPRGTDGVIGASVGAPYEPVELGYGIERGEGGYMDGMTIERALDALAVAV